MRVASAAQVESSVQPGQPVSTPATRARFDAVDWLRGLVMVLMALDHTRDFFHRSALSDPLNLSQTTTALFLTRWVTHFCAPVFVFLAGTGAYLSGTRGTSKLTLAWFLLTRGVWLILLEFTLVHLGWFFNFEYSLLIAQVIWAIGGSMIIMAALVALPSWALGLLGVALIAGLGTLDSVTANTFGTFAPIWTAFVRPGPIELSGTRVYVGYPILPWMGIMLAGYAFGALWLLERRRRRLIVMLLGLALSGLFVALRFANGYGDPRPWTPQNTELFTALSFVNCNKYPPSLLYVLMTLGPALVLLAAQDRERGPIGSVFVTFGRVPLFYYLLHVPLIHVVAIAFALIQFGEAGFLFQHPLLGANQWPADYGHRLPVVYLITLGVVAALYPLCRWFAGIKARRRAWWMGYL
jgi:uncharacterized membrane protein